VRRYSIEFKGPDGWEHLRGEDDESTWTRFLKTVVQSSGAVVSGNQKLPVFLQRSHETEKVVQDFFARHFKDRFIDTSVSSDVAPIIAINERGVAHGGCKTDLYVCEFEVSSCVVPSSNVCRLSFRGLMRT
jgi:hypothetical protein